MEIDREKINKLYDYENEQIEINTEINRRAYFGRGIAKYKDFTDNNLIAVRNHLNKKSNEILNYLINECKRAIRGSRKI